MDNGRVTYRYITDVSYTVHMDINGYVPILKNSLDTIVR